MSKKFIYLPPEDRPLEFIYIDEDVIVLSKPEGLLSVPGKDKNHKDCLESRLKKDNPEISVVHRLDMATSGIMVFARNRKAHRNLGLQFEKRKIYKEYVAHIWGRPDKKDGCIDLPIRCDWPNRPKQMVDHKSGKAAVTKWDILELRDNFSVVRLLPKTGRSHQLRVHMKELGHPILGDVFYGHEDSNKHMDRLRLHSKVVGFHLPKNGEFVYFSDPCPF